MDRSNRSRSRQELEAEHHPQAIESRVKDREGGGYLGDAILGAVDGSVTTFAVVAGVVGGGFSGAVVVVLGFAKLLADAFSMGVSNYLGTRSEQERLEQARRREHRHIEEIPEGERREIREIFQQKGFGGETLEEIVEVITQDRDLWVETMLTEELGLQLESASPLRAGLTTFLAFVLVGAVPLIPFLIPALSMQQAFIASGVVTALAFAGVGLAKGMALERPLPRSTLETLLTGGGAAVLAYAVGHWLRQAYGV